MNKRVYLCGPISSLSYDESVSWRKYLAERLTKDIVSISPMRGKEYLEGQKSIGFSYKDLDIMKDELGGILSSGPGITARDRFDVQNCDLVVANFLGTKEVSIGSTIELGWADAFRKPIILIAEKENVIRNHPITANICAFQTESLDTAIKLVNIILGENFTKADR